MTKKFYVVLVSGTRITFIYTVNGEFIGEGSLFFSHDDPDYTIPGKRIYLSRMIVKAEYRNRGIGGIIVDYLIDYAKNLGYEEMAIGVNLDNLLQGICMRKKALRILSVNARMSTENM